MKKIPNLSIIDQFSRKCLGLFVRENFKGNAVTNCLDLVARDVGAYPKTVTSDNGPEFISIGYETWAKREKILLDHITPGKPMQNGFVESFHGKFRDECLKANIFNTLKQCQQIVDEWREDYNGARPHSSLGNKFPDQVWKRSIRELEDALGISAT